MKTNLLKEGPVLLKGLRHAAIAVFTSRAENISFIHRVLIKRFLRRKTRRVNEKASKRFIPLVILFEKRWKFYARLYHHGCLSSVKISAKFMSTYKKLHFLSNLFPSFLSGESGSNFGNLEELCV